MTAPGSRSGFVLMVWSSAGDPKSPTSRRITPATRLMISDDPTVFFTSFARPAP